MLSRLWSSAAPYNGPEFMIRNFGRLLKSSGTLREPRPVLLHRNRVIVVRGLLRAVPGTWRSAPHPNTRVFCPFGYHPASGGLVEHAVHVARPCRDLLAEFRGEVLALPNLLKV